MTAAGLRTAISALDAAQIISRLTDLGPPSEIRSQSPMLAAAALKLDRVLLTSLSNGVLSADALYLATGRITQVLAKLKEQPVALEYPLVEGEILRRRRAQVVRTTADEGNARHAFADVLDWGDYVAAPVLVEGRVVGFFQGDRSASGNEIDEGDAEHLASFTACFGVVYERAVLRQRLRTQRHEMREVASWADARASELGDLPIGLDEDGDDQSEGPAVRSSGVGENALRDLLTRRELEVLKLMVRGETNVGIARELVVSEGTVKFHVKNILRKLHASNRADATSRYLRLTLDHGNRRSSALS
jgi:LuxR family transcriptional regulator, regulator of acetate metabolism